MRWSICIVGEIQGTEALSLAKCDILHIPHCHGGTCTPHKNILVGRRGASAEGAMLENCVSAIAQHQQRLWSSISFSQQWQAGTEAFVL